MYLVIDCFEKVLIIDKFSLRWEQNSIKIDLACTKTFQYGLESLSTMHQGAMAVAVHLAVDIECVCSCNLTEKKIVVFFFLFTFSTTSLVFLHLLF